MEKEKFNKRVLMRAAAAAIFGAFAVASFFLPSAATEKLLKNAGAVVVQAWDDAFDVSESSTVVEAILPEASDTPQETDAPVFAAVEETFGDVEMPDEAIEPDPIIIEDPTSTIEATADIPLPSVEEEMIPAVASSVATTTDGIVVDAPSSTAALNIVTTLMEPEPPATATNCGCPPIAATSTSVAQGVHHLLIAVVQIAGAASGNDFIKLYNPTTSTIALDRWRLKKRSKTGSDYSLKVFPEGSSVASGKYFIWANGGNGFGDSIGANVTSSETIAADNSVALFDADGIAIDMVAWGEGQGQYMEGEAYPANPEAGRVLHRRVVDGHYVDTDRNIDDFTI